MSSNWTDDRGMGTNRIGGGDRLWGDLVLLEVCAAAFLVRHAGLERKHRRHHGKYAQRPLLTRVRSPVSETGVAVLVLLDDGVVE